MIKVIEDDLDFVDKILDEVEEALTYDLTYEDLKELEKIVDEIDDILDGTTDLILQNIRG